MPEAADRPLVTFFVMAYNQERHVRAAIESAFAQTYKPLEILLSDDASTDATFRVMEEMASAYEGPHRVVLNRNPENLGIMAHVNRIMELSSGDLVVHAAGDDISLPHRVERLTEVWLAGKGDVKSVHSAMQEIDLEGRELRIRRPKVADWPAVDAASIIQLQANCTGATFAWSRELFDRFGPLPNDRDGVEDGPLFFRAALLGEIAYLDEPLVRYRLGGLSSSAGERGGRCHLYGYRIKRMRWWLVNYHSFLHDLERSDAANRDWMLEECRRRIVDYEFEISLADGSRLARLTNLPRAASLSLRHRSWKYSADNIKYLFDRIYMIYYDFRYNG